MKCTTEKIEEARIAIVSFLKEHKSENVEVIRVRLNKISDINFDWAVSKGLSEGTMKLNGVNLELNNE